MAPSFDKIHITAGECVIKYNSATRTEAKKFEDGEHALNQLIHMKSHWC